MTVVKQGWTDNHKPYGIYEKHIKRPLDLGLSLFALILLWPVMLVTAFLVRINIGKPVIFKQERPGLGGRIFTILKYRTMTDERDNDGHLLPDEARLTPFGTLLRKTSLDELPELINIIKGDMAIVGPRPLLTKYLPYYNEKEKHRHDVRPGLTGLAQVSGRNTLSWDKRFEADIEYADNITFMMDLRIIMKTVKKVSFREGVLEATSKGEKNFATERNAGRI